MIQGDKTYLRPLRRDDLPHLHRWLSDPEVAQYWQGRDYLPSLADIERKYIPRIEGMDPIDPTLRYFAIEVQGQPIGMIQYGRLEEEHRSAGVGILIGEKQFWDCGYGTDAICAFLRYLFDKLRLHRVWLAAQATNARAIRAYEKCGFVTEGISRESDLFEGHFVNTVLMAVLEHEFRALRSQGASKEAR